MFDLSTIRNNSWWLLEEAPVMKTISFFQKVVQVVVVNLAIQ